MDIEMVLNELWFQPAAPDVKTAQQWMNELVQTASAATRLGVQRFVRTRYDLDTLEIAPDYRIIQWRNDARVDREAQRFYRTLRSKAPLLTDDDARTIHDRMDVSEFRLVMPHGEALDQGPLALGFGAAYLLDGLALSFVQDGQWDRSQVTLEHSWLDDGSEATDCIIRQFVTVTHASRRVHVREHEP